MRDDLISRQAAIDTATEYEKQLREILGDENELAETVKILKHRIIALQPAQPEPQWIPCSERLPEKPNMYTVTDSKGDVVRFVFYNNESSREYWKRCAKAWMPLPEPWKEGE